MDQGASPIERLLGEARSSVTGLSDGQVATYIPELAKADPATFGMSLVTLDGHVYSCGDDEPFTIQSVSKPFVYALALADQGSAAVLAHIGVEPSGDPFNTISLDDQSGRPHNPMVNAGAIVATSLVGGSSRAAQLERLVDGLSAFAGRRLEIDQGVFASERATGDRNRAIAYLMRSAGHLGDDVDAAVELYFQQCSVLVTARDLAVMSATLAHGGTNPVTGEQVVPAEVVGSVLTVMTTCGMYDYAGEWLFRVGLPAKSGVSGGIAAALPGQFGLGVHSPPLDSRGNSVRGVAACEWLSRTLGLHLLVPTEQTRSAFRRSYRGDAVRSKRAWPPAHSQVLERAGAAIAVHELAGDQGFATAELVVRAALTDPNPPRWCVLDLRRVSRLDTAASALVAALADSLAARGVKVGVVEPGAAAPQASARAIDADIPRFLVAEAALEWAETELLADAGMVDAMPDGLVPFAEMDLMQDLDAATVDALGQRTTTAVFTAGTVIFDEGAPSDGLYFVAAGQVSVDVRVRGIPRRRRLSTIGPGGAVGELALVDGKARSARVCALEPTICRVMSANAFSALLSDDPSSAAALTLAIARSLSQRLRFSTSELAALQSG